MLKKTTRRPIHSDYAKRWNDEQEIEIRVSTLPSEYGESIVMRILIQKASLV